MFFIFQSNSYASITVLGKGDASLCYQSAKTGRGGITAVDSCLYRLYDPKSGELCGLLFTHIDDCFCCGAGKFYENKMTALRKEFPLGQWICA